MCCGQTHTLNPKLHMKFVLPTLPTLAISIAGVFLYTNELFVTTWYRSAASYASVPISPLPDCNTVISIIGCSGTGGVVCTIPAPGDKVYLVSKIVDSDPCELARHWP